MIMLSVVGAGLLSVVLYDVVVTALTMRSAGPLTSWTMQTMWRVALSMRSRKNHRVLQAGGTATFVAAILLWVLLLWIAWALVFLGSDGGVVDSNTGAPGGFWDIVYFAGFTLFTLGVGDFRPQGPLWQILTGLCVANGLLVLTMSVTYAVPVLSAAAGRRQLAAQIDIIGGTPDRILRFCWNGSDFSRIETELRALTAPIILLSQQHLAYPALHYFHSADPTTSLPLRLAALDEVLTVLLFAAPSGTAPDLREVTKTRRAIGILLDVMTSAHIEPSKEAPPPPDEEWLRRDDLPAFDTRSLAAGLEACSERRKMLYGWVTNAGRQWTDVWHTGLAGRSDFYGEV